MLSIQPIEVKSALFCRYVTNNSPLYKIGPLKMEVLSLVPYIVTFDDLVYDNEAKLIMNTSAEYLHSSSTKKHNGFSISNGLRKSST